jgi:hypothetical protein
MCRKAFRRWGEFSSLHIHAAVQYFFLFHRTREGVGYITDVMLLCRGGDIDDIAFFVDIN